MCVCVCVCVCWMAVYGQGAGPYMHGEGEEVRGDWLSGPLETAHKLASEAVLQLRNQ
jgi:hypothetical protein